MTLSRTPLLERRRGPAPGAGGRGGRRGFGGPSRGGGGGRGGITCPATRPPPISQSALSTLERALDSIFKKAGLDIGFTKHFLDRVNDRRNQCQITVKELMAIFNEVSKRYAARIKGKGQGFEAVIADVTSKINIPFVLKFDRKTGLMELRAKTVMRKVNFHSPDPKLSVTTKKLAADLERTGLRIDEGTPVPVDWPKRVGYPSPGVVRKTAYPAGDAEADDDWTGVPDGAKFARAQASLFPSKRVRLGRTKLKV
jgi:hypothetical protein